MTSEPDSKPERRPPTIELTATEVGKSASAAQSGAATGDGAAGPEASDKPAGGRSAGRLKSHAISAGFGAIAMAAIIGGLWISGFGPSHEAAAPVTPSAPRITSPQIVASQIAPDISARLDKIESVLQAQQALTSRIAAAEAQTKSLADSLTALNQHLDEIAGTSQSAAKQADAAQAAAEAAKSADQTALQRGDLDALANRIAALESTVKSLSDNAAHPGSAADDQAARLAIAAAALRAAVERGAPYGAELAAVQSFGADANALAPLQSFAATGVPSAAILAGDLATLTPALRHASDTAADGNSFLGRLEANAQQLVRITPVDAPVGNDPSAVIARMNVEAERGDIAAALSDAAQLPKAAKPLAADWVKQASAREAAITAARQLAADALAALNKPAAQ
jgi:hypothetical protein